MNRERLFDGDTLVAAGAFLLRPSRIAYLLRYRGKTYRVPPGREVHLEDSGVCYVRAMPVS